MLFVRLLWLQSQHHIQWETSHPQCPGWSHQPSRRQISSLTLCSCNNVTARLTLPCQPSPWLIATTWEMVFLLITILSIIHEFLLPQSLTVSLIVHLHPRTDLHPADTSSLCLYLPQDPLLPHVTQGMCNQAADCLKSHLSFLATIITLLFNPLECLLVCSLP